MPAGDPGGHFADTGGYGSFNQGGGGFQDGGSLSGGRGEYGLAGDRSYNSGNVGAYSRPQTGNVYNNPMIQALVKKRMMQRRVPGKIVPQPIPIDPVTGIPIPQPKPSLPSYNYMGPGLDLYQSNKYSNFPAGGLTPNFNDQHGVGYGGAGEYNQSPGDYIDHDIGGGFGPKDQSRLQFGGPALPGQTYTVGENGPETLQMGPGGGGQVIPHNLMDRMRGPIGGMGPRGPGGPIAQPGIPPAPGMPPAGGPLGPGAGGSGGPQGLPPEIQQWRDAMLAWRGQRPDRPEDMQAPGAHDQWRGLIDAWRQGRPDRPQMGGMPGPQISPGPAPGTMQPRPRPRPFKVGSDRMGLRHFRGAAA